MQDSIYNMTVHVTLFCNRVFGVKSASFFNIYATLLWASFHNVTKIPKPIVLHGVNHSQTRRHMIN